MKKMPGISSFNSLTIFQGIASLALIRERFDTTTSGNGEPWVMPLVFSFNRKQKANSTCPLHDPFLDVSGWLYIISAEFLSPNVHGRF